VYTVLENSPPGVPCLSRRERYGRRWIPREGTIGSGDSLLYIHVFRLFLSSTYALLVLPKEKPVINRLFPYKHTLFGINHMFFRLLQQLLHQQVRVMRRFLINRLILFFFISIVLTHVLFPKGV
jgi:hypothetical protein